MLVAEGTVGADGRLRSRGMKRNGELVLCFDLREERVIIR